MNDESLTNATPGPSPSPCLVARRRRWRLAALGLAGLSLALNWWGAGLGLPHLWHPDATRYVAAPWVMSYGDLNPRIGHNPPVFSFVMFAEKEAIRLWFHLFGSEEDLLRFRDNSGLTLAGRLTGGAFTAGCVLLVFRLGAVLAGRRAGFTGAVLLAVNFLFVRNSHFALNDIPMVCFLLLSAERSAAYLRWGRLSLLWQAAAVSGLAFATKYTGGAALFFPLVSAFARRRARAPRQPALLAAVCGAFFAGGALLSNPYFLFDDFYYSRDFLFMLRSNEECATFTAGGVPTWLSFPDLLRTGIGWVGSAVGVIGLGLMACRRPRWAVVLLTGPLVYTVAIVTRTVAHPRYVLPVIPFLAMGFTFALATWRRSRPHWASWLRMLTAVALIEPAMQSIRFDTLCTRDDTRVVAKRWIEEHVPRNAALVIDGNFPAMPSHPYAAHVKERLHMYGPILDPDYFVSNLLVREALTQQPDTAEVLKPVYRAIESGSDPVATFSPAPVGANVRFSVSHGAAPLVDLWKIVRPGPPIRIYQLRVPPPRSLDVPVRRRHPLTESDWRDILHHGICPRGNLLVSPARQEQREPSR